MGRKQNYLLLNASITLIKIMKIKNAFPDDKGFTQEKNDCRKIIFVIQNLNIN